MIENTTWVKTTSCLSPSVCGIFNKSLARDLLTRLKTEASETTPQVSMRKQPLGLVASLSSCSMRLLHQHRVAWTNFFSISLMQQTMMSISDYSTNKLQQNLSLATYTYTCLSLFAIFSPLQIPWCTVKLPLRGHPQDM